MSSSKGNLTGRHRAILALMFVVPLLLALGKWSIFPTSAFLTRFVSLTDIPAAMNDRLQYVLFVPLGALVVVFCRLTLGIRILGPFRSILLAVAFQITGIILGLIFLTIVIAVIVVVRPLLKAIRLQYYARVSVLMSAVCAIMTFTILMGTWLEADVLRRTAYFPIVVLCLMGEGFSRTLTREGTRSAMWRGVMTALLAAFITLLTAIPGLQQLMMRYPELLIVQTACIVLISEYFDLRLLQGLNPTPPPKATRSKRKSKKKTSKKAREAVSDGG